MVMTVCAAVTMTCYIGALGNNSCWDGEPRGIVVFVPLTDPPHGCSNEHTNYQHKHEGKHYLKEVKAHSKPKAHSFLSLLLRHGSYFLQSGFSGHVGLITVIPNVSAYAGSLAIFSRSRMIRIRTLVLNSITSFAEISNVVFRLQSHCTCKTQRNKGLNRQIKVGYFSSYGGLTYLFL